MKRKKIEFGCCFCGKSEADHGVSLVGMDGQWQQQWWCHVKCLLDAMVEEARGAYKDAEK